MSMILRYCPAYHTFFQANSPVKLIKSMTLLNSAVTDISSLEQRLKVVEKQTKRLQQEICNIKSIIAEFRRNESTTQDSRLSNKRLCENLIDEDSTDSKKLKLEFKKDEGYVVVFTDGACEGNGKPNAKAGIGVWFGEDNPLNISAPVTGKATNNNAEIQACTAALEIAKENGFKKVKIITDSQFVISSMTQWIKRWKKNNWKTASGGDVKNKEEFVKLDQYIQSLDVKWEHCNGHVGIRGNEEADRLARAGALSYKRN